MDVKKRWISLYVENEVGVLAKVSGLFSSKAYNLDSLTVGETEDETVSRMTIGLTSTDAIFEQIKKQLNRCVGVIKVMDFTNVPIHMREVLFIKLSGCTKQDKDEVFRIVEAFGLKIVDYSKGCMLIECINSPEKNGRIIKVFKDAFSGKASLHRGGSVAVEAL